MNRLVASLLVILAVCPAVQGCGTGDDSKSSGSAVERAFGGLSESDMELLEAWFKRAKAIPYTSADMAAAFRAEDLERARRNLDRLENAVNTARSRTIDFDSRRLRRALQSCVRPMSAYVATADRFLLAWEQEVDTGVPADDTTVNDLVADMQAAFERAQRADENFINRLMDAMSPPQRREFRRKLRSFQNAMKDRAGG